MTDKTIRLSYDGDEITVGPSRSEAAGNITIVVNDSQEERPCVGIASPAECDALIAAINAALGRKNDPASVVEAIIADLSDRRGLRQEWQAIDDDIRAEIKATWIRIARGGT